VLARGEGQRDAGLHLVVQRHLLGVLDSAVVVDHLDMAEGADHPLGRGVLVLWAGRPARAIGGGGALVVDYPVGAQGSVLIADLDIALGGGDAGLVVTNELVGLHVELASPQAVGVLRRSGPGLFNGLGRFVEDLTALVAAAGTRGLGMRQHRPGGRDRRAGEEDALAEYRRHAPARTHLRLPILSRGGFIACITGPA
jgi:hypothetical protein